MLERQEDATFVHVHLVGPFPPLVSPYLNTHSSLTAWRNATFLTLTLSCKKVLSNKLTPCKKWPMKRKDDNIINVGLCATLIRRGNSEANSTLLSIDYLYTHKSAKKRLGIFKFMTQNGLEHKSTSTSQWTHTWLLVIEYKNFVAIRGQLKLQNRRI